MIDTATRAAIDEAIVAALEHEGRVCRVYGDAVAQAVDEVGRKVFKVLADEEQGHVAYLEAKLAALRKDGAIEPGGLRTAIPPKDAIAAGVRALERKLDAGARNPEVELLRRALAVEQETSAFYRKLVGELPAEGQAFFRGFVAIEEGHVAIVQAEIDALTGTGFWFDFQEFDLEAG